MDFEVDIFLNYADGCRKKVIRSMEFFYSLRACVMRLGRLFFYKHSFCSFNRINSDGKE